jgi:hypothetical protein
MPYDDVYYPVYFTCFHKNPQDNKVKLYWYKLYWAVYIACQLVLSSCLKKSLLKEVLSSNTFCKIKGFLADTNNNRVDIQHNNTHTTFKDLYKYRYLVIDSNQIKPIPI